MSRIIVAAHASFCPGVRRAVTLLEQAAAARGRGHLLSGRNHPQPPVQRLGASKGCTHSFRSRAGRAPRRRTHLHPHARRGTADLRAACRRRVCLYRRDLSLCSENPRDRFLGRAGRRRRHSRRRNAPRGGRHPQLCGRTGVYLRLRGGGGGGPSRTSGGRRAGNRRRANHLRRRRMEKIL